MTLSIATKRFVLVDSLRGVAAMSVVLFHAYEGHHIDQAVNAMPQWFGSVLSNGQHGVAIFFALSGFVIAHTTYAYRSTPRFIGRFALRRALRLDPPYWFAIALCMAFAYVSSIVVSDKPAPDYQTGQVLAHLLYLQDVLGYAQISTVFWTLCQEVQFYLAHVILLWLSDNDPSASLHGTKTAWTMAVAALVSLLWPLGVLTTAWPGSFFPLWHTFLLGVGAYWAWRNPEIAIMFLVFAATIICASVFNGSLFSIISAATAFVLWFATGKVQSFRAWRPLLFLGSISYSLYLVHNPISGAAARIAKAALGQSATAEIGVLLAIIVASVMAASAVRWIIEKPSEQLAVRLAKLPNKAIAEKAAP